MVSTTPNYFPKLHHLLRRFLSQRMACDTDFLRYDSLMAELISPCTLTQHMISFQRNIHDFTKIVTAASASHHQHVRTKPSLLTFTTHSNAADTIPHRSFQQGVSHSPCIIATEFQKTRRPFSNVRNPPCPIASKHLPRHRLWRRSSNFWHS